MIFFPSDDDMSEVRRLFDEALDSCSAAEAEAALSTPPPFAGMDAGEIARELAAMEEQIAEQQQRIGGKRRRRATANIISRSSSIATPVAERTSMVKKVMVL